MEVAMAVTTTLSSREFNQDTGRAKRAAKRGPVIITDRDEPTYVLLSIEEYRKITGRKKNILEALAMPEAAEIEFDPPRLGGELARPAEFD
jgi:prevent-host-death family protein